MNWRRALILPVLVLLLAACGGTGASEAAETDDSAPSTAASATPAESEAPGSAESAAPSEDEDDDDGNGGGGDADLEELAGSLEPPNSTEVGRFSSQGGLVLAYESSESVDALRDFYEDAIEDLGLTVVGTASVEGGQTWIFGEDDRWTVGGTVTIVPTDGGSSVNIGLGSGQ